jgi:hypothetical protein
MSEKEEWRPVAGYEGIYEVSDLGRVRSLDRDDCTGRKRKGRVLVQCNVMGYKFVNLSRNGEQWVIRVHSLVATAFIGARSEGMTVNHKNCDKADNRAGNLEYMTIQENLSHAKDNDRLGTPQKVVQAIRYILQRNRNFPYDLLAAKFGISQGLVSGIAHARVHCDVPNLDGTPVVSLDSRITADAVLVLREVGIEARELAKVLDVEYSAPFRSLNRAGIWQDVAAAD